MKTNCTCDNEKDRNRRHHTDGCARSEKPAAHTPTPWHIDGSYHDGNEWIISKNGESVCEILKNSHDAAFIVRAVNAHEEMLKALKELRDEVIYHNQRQKSTLGFVGGHAIHAADQAIAKAEGK